MAKVQLAALLQMLGCDVVVGLPENRTTRKRSAQRQVESVYPNCRVIYVSRIIYLMIGVTFWIQRYRTRGSRRLMKWVGARENAVYRRTR